MATEVWVHNLNPILLRFNDTLGVRWYGLAYLSGFFFGAVFMLFMAKRRRLNQSQNPTHTRSQGSARDELRIDLVIDFITYVVVGTMLGGRLGYALFYGQELLTDVSGHFPFWGVLRVWEGGMASHGGIAGIVAASALFAWRHGLNWLHLGDLTTVGGSIGIFFGRIANFINGELFGRPAPEGTWFAVKFPSEMYLWLKQDLDKHISDPITSPGLLSKITPTVDALGLNVEQWKIWLGQIRSSASAQINVQAVIDQIIAAVQSGDERVRSVLGRELTARYPSQLLEASLEGLLLFVVIFLFWRKPHKPGVVGGLWLMAYSFVRILGEQFRMPDAHIGFDMLGLTRGQWLSVAIFIGGAAIFEFSRRQPGPRVGGWGLQTTK